MGYQLIAIRVSLESLKGPVTLWHDNFPVARPQFLLDSCPRTDSCEYNQVPVYNELGQNAHQNHFQLYLLIFHFKMLKHLWFDRLWQNHSHLKHLNESCGNVLQFSDDCKKRSVRAERPHNRVPMKMNSDWADIFACHSLNRD